MHQCYLGLGSNLGNRERNLMGACRLLEVSCGEVVKQSTLYETEAWGYSDSQNYYNQVICIQTSLTPTQLLDKCLSIEQDLGRTRSGRGYEARTVDIDILFYGNQIIETDVLKIPHEHLHKRLFVLKPLMEIAPDLVHPVLNLSVIELLTKCDDDSWIKIVGE